MKKTASFMLALLMLVSIIPIGAIHSLAVTSSDGLYEYNIVTTAGGDTAEIAKYNGTGGDVTIPSTIDGYTVTSIGNGAFLRVSSLTSVIIPNSVTSIGDGAFSNCTGLASVAIPDTVTSIGNSSFYGCSNLISLTIGAGVTSIGNRAFYKCGGLAGVTIPDNVTSIGDGIFGECANLKNVTIGNGVKAISRNAFYNCPKLINLTIGANATSIDEMAFTNCVSLTSVTLPSSVTSIGSKAFGYDSNGNKVSGFTINGLAGSAAETYAKTNGFPFYTPGGDVIVKTTLSGTSMPDTGTYSVEIPADLSIVWGTTTSTDVSYKVTSHLALGATLDISIASANTNSLKESKNKYSIPYTFAQFSKKTFNEINSNVSSVSTITVSDANWKAVPIAEYSDTLTYSVTYVKGI